MKKKEASSTKSYVEDTIEKWGDKKSVYAKISIETNIYVSDLMKIIIDNWDVIDEKQRHEFARKIYALDLQDTMRLGKPEKSFDDEDFHWR